MAKKKRKTSKVRNVALDVILVCLIAIFTFSCYKVYTLMKAYKADQSVYSAVREQAGDVFTGDIDWNALRATNPDIVGWIYLEGTPINYPIVQGKDNDRYLHMLFDGTPGGAGTLFTDCNTDDPFRQFSTIVYGHHMRDGSMFNGLNKFKDTEYVKKHNRFELITPEGKYHLDVVAFLNQPADSPIYQANVGKGSEQNYLNTITDLSSYMTSNTVTTEDRIVLLSTCAYEYDNARYVVVGKMTPWE